MFVVDNFLSSNITDFETIGISIVLQMFLN